MTPDVCVEARRASSFREGRLPEPSESSITCEVLGVNGIRQVLIRRDLADPLGSLQDENMGKRSSRQDKTGQLGRRCDGVRLTFSTSSPPLPWPMMSLCRLNMGLEVLQSKERRRCGTLTTSFPSTLQAPKTSSPWKPGQSRSAQSPGSTCRFSPVEQLLHEVV